MHDLLRAAAEIWRETGCGRQLRLIGGLAVPALGYLVRQGYRLHEQAVGCEHRRLRNLGDDERNAFARLLSDLERVGL